MRQRLKKIKQSFYHMDPEKKKLVSKVAFLVSVFLLLLIDFASLGLTGANFMVWSQLATDEKRQNTSYANYLIKQQVIMGFDAVCLLTLGLLLFSVFKFYTKGNLIIISLNAAIWVGRWLAGLLFLFLDPAFRNTLENDYKSLHESKMLSELCLVEECLGTELINYVSCGKIVLWKETWTFQVVYTVLSVFLLILLCLLAYFANKFDVGLVEFSEEQQAEEMK